MQFHIITLPPPHPPYRGMGHSKVRQGSQSIAVTHLNQYWYHRVSLLHPSLRIPFKRGCAVCTVLRQWYTDIKKTCHVISKSVTKKRYFARGRLMKNAPTESVGCNMEGNVLIFIGSFTLRYKILNCHIWVRILDFFLFPTKKKFPKGEGNMFHFLSLTSIAKHIQKRKKKILYEILYCEINLISLKKKKTTNTVNYIIELKSYSGVILMD